MSSIESMVSEIDDDYENILSSFESRLTKELYYRFDVISENDLLKLLQRVMRFQRRIEESIASVKKIAGRTEYMKRLEEISKGVFEKLYSEKQIDSVKFCVYPNPEYASYLEDVQVSGVITELKSTNEKCFTRTKGTDEIVIGHILVLNR